MTGTATPDPVFPGTSVMAGLMRAHDWTASPLGSPSGWPPSLKIATSICLTSRFPMIVWWGPQLRFLYNDAYLPLLGGKHPALDKPGAEVWGEIWPIIGPMLHGVLDTGEPTWSEDLLLPMSRHGYWEETYWTYSYSPLLDDEGRAGGVFTAVTETTERVIGARRLAALRDLGAQAGAARTVEEACRLVGESLGRAHADVPYFALYLKGDGPAGLTLASQTQGSAVAEARRWPLSRALAESRPLTMGDLVGQIGELPAGSWSQPPGEAMILPLYAAAESIGVLVLAASAGHRLDGDYQTFMSLAARQIASLINGASAYQAQQRRAEELAELDRAKTTFFSNISHEFRTPLTLIMGPVEELRGRLHDAGPAIREDLDVVRRNAMRMGKLVNALLDFSRIEAGRSHGHFEPVDLAELTTDLGSAFRAGYQRAGLGFEVDCPPLAEAAYVDREMWEKVVLNLLSNALKYTVTGSIQLSLTSGGGRAVLRVIDTGVGISAQDMPHIFERFHRGSVPQARSNEGSGIGLALVKELVALHGGTITADSRPGGGSTFTVSIPLGREHLADDSVFPASQVAPPAAADSFLEEALRWASPVARPGPVDAPGPVEAPGPDSGADDGSDTAPGLAPRVLIADDNADMRDYLRRLLQSRYHVTAVGNGRAALEAARTQPPDLVISDVMMPEIDGLGLVSALRTDPRTAGLPVLLLSARAGEEAAVDGLAAGADDYLTKPFAAQELLARARAVIDLTRMRTRQARLAAERESAVTALTSRLLEAGTRDEMLRAGLGELHRLLGASRATAALWHEDDAPAVITVPASTVTWDRLPGPLRGALQSLRSRPALEVTATAEPPAGAGSVVEYSGNVVAVWVDLDGRPPLGLEDRTLLALLCGRLGQALNRVHLLDQQREVALTLQHALLGPSQLPPGFAVRYEPATPPLEVGGDWYDVAELPGGRIGIVVGDCVGRGLAAASVMGQLRSACRALLLNSSGPAQALTALDRFATLIPDALCSTVFCGILDPVTGRLRYASAGHPPGILSHPGGRVELLDQGRSAALALFPGELRGEAEVRVPEGATLLLYTDGLVERRDLDMQLVTDRAAVMLQAAARTTVAELAGQILTALMPGRGYEDDVALLLYSRPVPLVLDIPADPDELAVLRRELNGWLTRFSVDPLIAQDVLIAACEACANAIEHGYRDAPGGTVGLRVEAAGRDLLITVSDQGRWQPPRQIQDRGHGLELIRATMHDVTITAGDLGTTIEMRAATA